jgi:antitoxin MazE
VIDRSRGCNYNVDMRTKLIKVGNSRGIRLPKALIEQCGLHDEVELEVQDEQIVVRRAKKPREGWEEAFAEMARLGDDQLLDPETPTEWDQTEWTW